MNKRFWFLTAFLFCLTAFAAQDRETLLLDELISRGNRAYETGQRTRIMECADSIEMLLDKSTLSREAKNDYRVSYLKLRGNYYYELDEFDKAEDFYSQAQEIIDKFPNNSFHNNRLLLPREIAQLYYRMERYNEACSIMEKVCDELEYNQRYQVGSDDWLTSWMTYAMCLARIKKFKEALQIADSELKNALDKKGLAYAKALRMQAKIKLLANADEKGALKAYKSFFETQKKYAMDNFAKMNASERQEYWHSIQPFVTDCYLLENTDPGFIYDVTLFSKGLLLQLSSLSGEGVASKDALKSLSYNWKDIQKKIKKGQAAAEFIHYKKSGADRLAAVLVKKTGTPVFIPLSNVDYIIKSADFAMGSDDKSLLDDLYTDEVIQNAVWNQDFIRELQGIDRLYFAPDGKLHIIAIEYFPQVADIEMFRVTSTRKLMETAKPFSKDAPMLLVGAIDFYEDGTPSHNPSNDQIAYYYCYWKRFPQLDSLNDESRIVSISRNYDKDKFISGTEASEKMFSMIAPEYESILVSTHGDFNSNTPVSTDIKPVGDDYSMSENIIAFSGINDYLEDVSFDASASFDGILSAKELSEMNLSKCRLFTVSACKTGLGEISADGVFGLQRGLKNAGVGAMMLSLWSVNSLSTSYLMRQFYSYLQQGFPMRKALMNAREDLKNVEEMDVYISDLDFSTWTEKVIASTRYVSFKKPQYYDAFILVDAFE